MSEAINTVDFYVDVNGVSPFRKWLDSLRDKKAAGIVVRRIERMEIDLLGDARSIGDGLSELKIDYGPGYRVYYRRQGRHVYILLCGGDKSTQSRDIERAKAYWKEFKEREQG